mmetsp:Transcript_18728/g.36085  ORF Transcript_18728/g.36085 Transcript_18728/m.36085 type:complete len:96 (+) Transcript_18728:2399-2686(+)
MISLTMKRRSFALGCTRSNALFTKSPANPGYRRFRRDFESSAHTHASPGRIDKILEQPCALLQVDLDEVDTHLLRFPSLPCQAVYKALATTTFQL